VDGHASISPEVLARYAAGAAREVEGVRGLVASQLHRHRGVRVVDGPTIELHLDVDWGAEIPAVGRSVQRVVAEYLQRMAGTPPAAVNVVVDSVGPAR
jgi:uncharacterized alkaline shock family protein YloU